MLSSLVKEHQLKQVTRKEKQEQKRKEAIAAASNLTQALVDHLNVGVAQAYLNQKRLDAEAKQLHHSATNFAKQTQQWVSLVESFSSALKEIGDVENWAHSIEEDMRTITSALEYAYKDNGNASEETSDDTEEVVSLPQLDAVPADNTAAGVDNDHLQYALHKKHLSTQKSCLPEYKNNEFG